ncbi:hypothetical protein, partial [Nostoc sp.]|uniref:hypothetical protein n=1 Tax=Nostoc sp. TaxID=1180 RepID=UPI002FF55DDA
MPLASLGETPRPQWLPFLRGTLIPVPPLKRGVRGDQQVPKITVKYLITSQRNAGFIGDFQRIKYTVNKNDNHFKGEKGVASVFPFLPQ